MDFAVFFVHSFFEIGDPDEIFFEVFKIGRTDGRMDGSVKRLRLAQTVERQYFGQRTDGRVLGHC
jgi:hypothetical protein